MIKELSKDEKNYGYSGFGEEFEKIVNNKLENLIYHEKKIIKRNIFSLVGLTESSKKYLDKMEEKENTEFYDFFDLKRIGSIIKIDGIKEDKIKSSDFNIKDYDVYLNQISKTGRSFDSGLLIKKDKNKESQKHDLVLFQDTTNKIVNKEKKLKYINDSYLSKNYLENLYEDLRIDQIYFIFILPPHYPNVEDTKKKLEELQIFYVYYSYKKNIFLDKDNKIIIDFRITDANITFKEIKNYNYIKSLSDIKTCKKVFELSKKKYFNKIGAESFANIYNKVSEGNFYDCIVFSISKNLKNKILECFYEENYFTKQDNIIFLPSTNYLGNKIKDLFNETENMIIFSYNENVYLYYYNFYEIKKKKDNFKIKKTSLDLKSSDDLLHVPTKDFEDFDELKRYPLYLFCYQIIKNYMI